jgi:hypothetical protein
MKTSKSSANADFAAIHDVFQAGQQCSLRLVHRAMIETYLAIGSILCRKTREDGWTEAEFQKLSDWLIGNTTSGTTFTVSNLMHMRRFHEVWNGKTELLPRICELSWPCHLVLMEQCKSDRERETYLAAALDGKWTRKELESRIRAGGDRREASADD